MSRLSLFFLALSTACTGDVDDPVPSESAVPQAALPYETFMRGTLPGVGDFDEAPRDLEIDSSSIEMWSYEEWGWAMYSVYVFGGVFGEGPLAPGSVVEFSAMRPDADDGEAGMSDDPDIEVIGCSGVEEGDMDFDGDAVEYRLRVEEGARSDELVVDLWASFEDGEIGLFGRAIVPTPGR